MNKELEWLLTDQNTFSKEKEALDYLYDLSCNVRNTTIEYKIVLEALILNSKKSKALEIIITRAIDIFTLMWCFYNHKTYEDYMANKNTYSGNPNIEEYNLLIEVLQDEN